MKAKVAVISGSESDRAYAEEAISVLSEFGIEVDGRVISAHRNPRALDEFTRSSDADLFIGIAGLSAALPGAIAARTTKPVIGVPISAKLDGIDALLSIVQMPTGIPVACVGIDNAKNAALLAVEILSINDAELAERLKQYRGNWS